MRRQLLIIALLASAVAGIAQAQQAVLDGIQSSPGQYDPIGVNGVSVNATMVAVSTTGSTGAAVATMAAVAAKTNYVCGFSIDAAAGAATDGLATLAGMIGGTMSFLAPVNLSTPGSVFRTFTPCLPASAVNTALVLTGPVPGASGVSTVNIWGFVR